MARNTKTFTRLFLFLAAVTIKFLSWVPIPFPGKRQQISTTTYSKDGIGDDNGLIQPLKDNEIKKRLQFVHIPKTGGTVIELAAKNAEGAYNLNISWGYFHFASFKQIILPYEAAKLVGGTPNWHLPPYYFDYYNNSYNPYAHSTLFTVVRDPYHRAVSEYRYKMQLLHKENKVTKEKMNDWLRQRLSSMPERMSANPVVEENPRYYQLSGHFIPQYDFVFDKQGQRTIRHVLKFENLHQEFPILMKQYNLSSIVLPIEKSGRHSSNVKVSVDDLSEDVRTLIETVFAKDFEMFHYEKIY